ncbi:MAG: glycosyltransferase family 2 protein [Pseudomonadota bacterium]
MTQTIAMFWGETALSYLEQLCLQSYLDVGHPVTLFTYGDVENVPAGVVLADAGAFVPEHVYRKDPERVVDMFRYRVLAACDRTIWSDPDVVCLHPLEPLDGYLFGWESETCVSHGLLALPQDCAVLGHLLDGAPASVLWSTGGAAALTEALRRANLLHLAVPQEVFFPLDFGDGTRLLTPPSFGVEETLASSKALHLFRNRLQRDLAALGDVTPHPASWLGGMLGKHGIHPDDAPLFAAHEDADARALTPVTKPKVRPLDHVVAVTCMRNEGPFILDWVAYHMGVGVTHFLVYTNDCDDETEALLDALALRGLVTRVANPVDTGEAPQRAALDDAATHPLIRRADAVIVMDVDEYMNIHVGQGQLTDLFEAAGDPDLISMTWQLFGCSGAVAFEDEPVPARFTRSAPPRTRKPHQAWGFKTILRREAPFSAFGVHRPQEPTGSMPHWTNGSGAQLPEQFLTDGWRSTRDTFGADLVTLNHYAVRSCESFLVKRDRGRANHVAREIGLEYWNTMNRNDQEETSILARLSLGEGLRTAFAKDPVIGALHDRAVTWHRARVADLQSVPREAAVFAAITEAPMSNTATAADLPEPSDAPPTARARGNEIFPLRQSPPATGRAAEAQFRGLMDRIRKRQQLLVASPMQHRAEKIVVVTSMKNEGCFILEWIAFHLSIGVTHFLVYTNDCDDPTNAILDRLQSLGIVTRKDNPFNRTNGQKPQRGALNDAIEHPVVSEADWVGVIDVDEFVNIHVGDGTFQDLLRVANDPNVVSMTWRFFGNKGVHRYEDRWQTEQFTACAPLYIPKPRLGWGFKSFFRMDAPFNKIGVHRPLELEAGRLDEVRWVNGAGRVMPERVVVKNEWFSRKDTIGYDMVTLNHYVLRSAESFLVKRQRGRVNHVDQDQGFAYWSSRNYATETDRSIHRHLSRAKARLDALLADRELAALHQLAVDWHQTRIATLLKEDDYRTLYQAITDPSLPDAIWRDRVTEKQAEDLDAAE